MGTIQEMHPRHRVGFQSDAATAANAALWAAQETMEEHASMLADVKRVFGTRKGNLRPETPSTSEEARTARRSVNMLRDAAERMAGVVSASACGLWVIVGDNIGQVESTNHGRPYLRGVDFAGTLHEEVDVLDATAFFDSEEAAREYLHPSPRWPN